MDHKAPLASNGIQKNIQEEMMCFRENAAEARETAVMVREDAAGVREVAAEVREGQANSREKGIHELQTIQSAKGDYIQLLRQANERLIIATVEAQKMAEQVKVATDQMECAKFAAEKANQAKSNFLSSMSHELRTPLNAILGFSQLLEGSTPAPTAVQAERLHKITTAGWYLLELINKILDIGVIEAGKLTLAFEPVSLSEILSECKLMIEFQAQEHDVHVNFLSMDEACIVYADRTRFKQVVLNLLTNAIKYNHPRGTVEVKCSALPQHVRIDVKDSGIGLSPEKQAELFQPFNRLGQECGSEQGTGIGLAVTKQLVELMGGNIGFTSQVGVGSDFWIELPREITQ